MVTKVAMVLLEGIIAIKGQKTVEAYNKIKARVMESIMVGNATKVAFVLLVTLVIIIPCFEANIGEFDNFLKAQVKEAYKFALNAYVPIPEDVTNELNLHVHSTWENSIATRRKGWQGSLLCPILVMWLMDSTIIACSESVTSKWILPFSSPFFHCSPYFLGMIEKTLTSLISTCESCHRVVATELPRSEALVPY
ncbi:hypothetical protein CR513_51845, partial [Mucuna pruriens]